MQLVNKLYKFFSRGGKIMSTKWEKQGANTGKLTFEITPDKVKEA